MVQYAEQGFLTNVDVFFPGLTTVSVPLASSDLPSPYVLNCTSATPVLADTATRQAAGEMLVEAARKLAPAVRRLQHG
jgi:DNA-binding IclR family transcriptional regulator